MIKQLWANARKRPILNLVMLALAIYMLVYPLVQLARADTPLTKIESSAALQGTAGAQLGMGIATNNTTVVCLTDTGAEEPKLIPWGAQAVITCASPQVYAFWTLADNADVNVDTTTLEITDAGGLTGKGPGVTYNGGYRSTYNSQSNLGTSAVGYRSSQCTTAGGTTTGRPCRQQTDCVGADTCVAVTSAAPVRFAYLCLKSLVTASVNCQVSFEP